LELTSPRRVGLKKFQVRDNQNQFHTAMSYMVDHKISHLENENKFTLNLLFSNRQTRVAGACRLDKPTSIRNNSPNLILPRNRVEAFVDHRSMLINLPPPRGA
jgi:hypothetical protein